MERTTEFVEDQHRIPLLTEAGLSHAVAALAKADPDLARVLAAFDCPPLWQRTPDFSTLVYIILEQQVSLASARAAFSRLEVAGPVTPEVFLGFSDAELNRIGFSRQKAGYCRELAHALASGELDLSSLDGLDDQTAHSALIRLKGVGPWTAGIYLLMALRRAGHLANRRYRPAPGPTRGERPPAAPLRR